jgi:pimeloyl-ACP methyl ester carboxylesterase
MEWVKVIVRNSIAWSPTTGERLVVLSMHHARVSFSDPSMDKFSSIVANLTRRVARAGMRAMVRAVRRMALVPKDVSARGARIRFVEAGAGAPLLLIHDFAASREVWTRTISRFAEGFRVIAPDLPGFGASEKPDPQRYAYGWDAFSDSMFDLLAALGTGRVHVCGHGMGAGVALSLAARHPALVDKLVLTSALVFPPASEHALDRTGRVPLLGALMWRQFMGHALFRSYLQSTVYSGASKIPAERADELFTAFNAPAGRQAAHATLVAKADTRPLVARLPRVTATTATLVIWGRDDEIAPVEHGRRLARELRGRFEVLECGRCPPDELPDAFATAVISFLERESPVSSSRSGEKKPASKRRSATP